MKQGFYGKVFTGVLPFMFGLMLITTGCRSLPTPEESTANVSKRNNAASLLYGLMGDEQNVSKLLIIKRDRRELNEVIKNISATAGAARKSLEKLAAEDATLNLKVTALPAGEKATRESESKARAGELLRASGAGFEFQLLLTQAEALAYTTHLAKVAAENETVASRAEIFRAISAQLKARHGDVLNLLRAPAPRR